MKPHTIALLLAAAGMATACTQTDPHYDNSRLDSTGSHYETTAPSQPVGENMRNSTVNSSADRQSSRYPVGNGGDSNPY